MKLNTSRGFTLLELLVVISIISLLTSIILASLNSARQRAEISKVIQNISSIQKALELYYAKYNYYPNVSQVPGAPDQLASTTRVLFQEGYLGAEPDFPQFFEYANSKFYIKGENVSGLGYECLEQGIDPTGGGPTYLSESYMITFPSRVLLPYKVLYFDGNSQGQAGSVVYCVVF